ncbi:MAG: flagellar hook-basal body complex protein [Thermoleophilia bacterium]|jgi:flagellar hook protein FlgE|nr:flagellar hook-basal body complex protein [Thermoleophilia bacterium]
MMRSMFSGVSGLRTHQTMMDVLSSNISNVNTFGYKSQRTTFKDALTQNLAGAGAPTANMAGTNPRQVGLGMTLSSIDNLMTQGNAQSTGSVTDVMIQGDGFFRLARGTDFTADNLNAGVDGYFTRAGNFTFDANGYLVNAQGLYVVGYNTAGANPGTQLIRLKVDPATTQAINVAANGAVSQIDNAGTSTTIGFLSLAKFNNSSGLERAADNLWRVSNNSGAPIAGTPGGTGLGQVVPGALEMSNVDLALEFTNMIIAQRGFQANGKAITASDEMLQELVNLKR